jgi:SAM-dependent methyltransferase
MVLNSIAFDRAAGYYDETRGFPPGEEEAVATLISRAGRLTRTSKVVEIGVGTGRIALPLATHVGAYYGVDISRPMMARLRAKQSGERVYLVEADAAQLPFTSHVFNAAVAVHVFHLIPDWQGVLRELARVLRPDAPLLHCWGEPDSVFRSLWDSWRQALPAAQTEDIGVRWEKNPTVLLEHGWRPSGEDHVHVYTYQQTPTAFLERLQNRIWSQTWRLSDAELVQGVEAVKATIAATFSHPQEPVMVTSNFHVRAYLPPKA